MFATQTSVIINVFEHASFYWAFMFIPIMAINNKLYNLLIYYSFLKYKLKYGVTFVFFLHLFFGKVTILYCRNSYVTYGKDIEVMMV